ncbi:MAG: thiol:disulfide interchange protein DsbA/DsbL [Deltaproteobacteria bacterium]|jgi:thiol:disulfide interchange protein DsbA|nr:thiol:disulfide interchange protein DsbA/DsbL [Deltaproteobacteria bacterium]
MFRTATSRSKKIWPLSSFWTAVILTLAVLSVLDVKSALADEAKTAKPQPPFADFYQAVRQPVRFDETDDKIELVVFFWYGCGACRASDSSTHMFLSALPDDVRVVKLPALFDSRPEWLQHGRLFFTLEKLGVESDLRSATFAAVQAQDGGRYTAKLMTREAQETFAAANGVDRADFRAAYDSPEIEEKLKRTTTYMNLVDLDSVPAMVVNGRYIFTFVQGPRYYQQAERLINQERERLKAAKEAKSGKEAKTAEGAK